MIYFFLNCSSGHSKYRNKFTPINYKYAVNVYKSNIKFSKERVKKAYGNFSTNIITNIKKIIFKFYYNFTKSDISFLKTLVKFINFFFCFVAFLLQIVKFTKFNIYSLFVYKKYTESIYICIYCWSIKYKKHDWIKKLNN